MRGSFEEQETMCSYMTLEERVPERQLLRSVRGLVREVLLVMDKGFRALYAKEDRPSILLEQGSVNNTTERASRLKTRGKIVETWSFSANC